MTDAGAFRRLVAERSGLALTPEKDYLLKSRLEPLARELGVPDLAGLLAAAVAEPRGEVARRAVDAMATHESSFFRDGTPFDQLRGGLLAQVAGARPAGGRLRIWSAACSSGQEPYSLAMLMLEEASHLAGRTAEIVATDMSEPILAKARTALYSDFEVRRGLSPERKARWMEPVGTGWRVAPQVRALVRFQRHNLLESAAGLGRFDLVFCRNVLIYFDAERKAQALSRVARTLEPHGALVLGSSETVVGVDTALAPVAGLRGVLRWPPTPERLTA